MLRKVETELLFI